MSSDTKLTKDEECESVDSTKYQGMIGSLLYLTASRPDIMFSVCLCARFQKAPKTSHLEAVKRIFRYIKGTMHLGLWYPKGTDIETVVYADSDRAGDYVEKTTSGIYTFVGCCLTSWFSKKQTALAISTTEAEHISTGKACQQALWMKQALIDYDVRLDDFSIMCDNKGLIGLSKSWCNTLELNTSKFVTTFFVIMSRKDISLSKSVVLSIAGTTSTEQPLLKDKSMWSDQEKRIQKIDHLARSLLIQGLPNDIYSLIDSNKTAKDLWDALARHVLGSEHGEQDMKAAVLYEYETFKANEEELLLDTYIRYLQVINDLKKCGYSKDNCELNFKFLNNLQPEWKQYATMMRQNKNLMDINIDALYNILN
nr:retrovirus-related Pol polyprotein from transposon TNT 1-94 [Tanacetum cinerariifolium]